MTQPKEVEESCCKPRHDTSTCPVCDTPGRKVSAITLDNHVPVHLRGELQDQAMFCPNKACKVVYYDGAGKMILAGETRLPVTLKDSGDDVYACYCFEFKRRDIRRDLLERGRTDIPEQIKKGVQEGRCDCERKNPQGSCCLGNVVSVIKTIQAEMQMAK